MLPKMVWVFLKNLNPNHNKDCSTQDVVMVKQKQKKNGVNGQKNLLKKPTMKQHLKKKKKMNLMKNL